MYLIFYWFFSLFSVITLTSLSFSFHQRLRRTALSFSHLIYLACSSFHRSLRSKSSPSPTRSSKPSRRTSPSPATRTEFSDGETWGFVLSAEEQKLDHHVDEDEDLDAEEQLSLSLISSIFGVFWFFYWICFSFFLLVFFGIPVWTEVRGVDLERDGGYAGCVGSLRGTKVLKKMNILFK